MIELSQQNVQQYLRDAGKASMSDLLIQSLSGGVSNIVLKIFDPGAGEKVGTDMRSVSQIKRGAADTRMAAGDCFVLKQPLPKFKTQAEWLVDIDRVLVERDCIELLANLLPAGSVPPVRWFDAANYILAIECAPTEAVIWKKDLLAGRVSRDAAVHAGMLLAMMHSATFDDAAVKKRYGDVKFFSQQRLDPYLLHTAARHADVAKVLRSLAGDLEKTQLCLIHGDYSPKNIFLVPAPAIASAGDKPARPALSHLMLLDFEVAYYGHPAFDVSTLVNHLMLKAFHHKSNWRPFMVAADAFWQTYMHTADKTLVRIVSSAAGRLLGALLLARVDGKSPAEYITDENLKNQIRAAAKALLNAEDGSLDHALDNITMHFDSPA
jgi:5-methylthioribose kinase